MSEYSSSTSLPLKEDDISIRTDEKTIGENDKLSGIEIGIDNKGQFYDSLGRTIFFRGINVAADSKLPTIPFFPSHEQEDFLNGDNVKFIGAPFPLEEADEHLIRLKNLGFNLVRFMYTWEALEHEGPKKYDEEYIDYVIKLLEKFKKYNIKVIMNIHQDVWSRFTGGSGAPMWTLYAAGLNPANFNYNEAAIVQNTYENVDKFPRMIWPTNYNRLACMTMLTLFFGGKDFAPKCIIDGVNIQDYLRNHLLNAIKHFAQRIYSSSNINMEDIIIGWETLNEANCGLIGHLDLSEFRSEFTLHVGSSPTPFQSMCLGQGYEEEIDIYELGSTNYKKTGTALINKQKQICWLDKDYDDTRYGWKRDPNWDHSKCIWALHGIWDINKKKLHKPNYFSQSLDGAFVDDSVWINKYFVDFIQDFISAIRSVNKTSMIFIESPVFHIPPKIRLQGVEEKRIVFCPHYYDGLTLMHKSWNRNFNVDVIGILRGDYKSIGNMFAVRLGYKYVRNCIRDQIHRLKREGEENMGKDVPCVFTEIGIPFDMNNKDAYKTKDYSAQIEALDTNMYGLESGAINYCLWSYCAINSHKRGDHWNGEDFSIWSADDCKFRNNTSVYPINDSDKNVSKNQNSMVKMYDGVRALKSVVRPCPIAVCGENISYSFDINSQTFQLSFSALTKFSRETPTEIFLPILHFGDENEIEVITSSGKWDYNEASQVFRWWHGYANQTLTIKSKKSNNSSTCNECCIM